MMECVKLMKLTIYALSIYAILSRGGGGGGGGGVRPAAAAAYIYDFIYGSCDSTAFYANTSAFGVNLGRALEWIYSTSGSYIGGRYGYTSGSDAAASVYAIYRCRSDLTLNTSAGNQCQACVADAMSYYCRFPNGSSPGGAYVVAGLTVMLRGCYFKYGTNPEYMRALIDDPGTKYASCAAAADPALAQQQQGVPLALRYVRAAAPAAPARFASVAIVDSRSVIPTVYALAQCLSNLTSSECSACLALPSSYRSSSSSSTNCSSSSVASYSSAAFYLAACFYTFNTSTAVAFNNVFDVVTATYNTTFSPPPPPLLSPPPPTPSSPKSPPPPPTSSPPKSPPPASPLPTRPSDDASSPPLTKSTAFIASVSVAAGGIVLIGVIIGIFIYWCCCCQKRQIPPR